MTSLPSLRIPCMTLSLPTNLYLEPLSKLRPNLVGPQSSPVFPFIPRVLLYSNSSPPLYSNSSPRISLYTLVVTFPRVLLYSNSSPLWPNLDSEWQVWPNYGPMPSTHKLRSDLDFSMANSGGSVAQLWPSAQYSQAGL
ncbi:hypothetical protein VNO77_19008 [Canavalia gladiata]|uniref:Uncharacterized protein n=1 Tax=Canavalia gladiata TaxID=3824 RepID=A0AAN9LLZ1_CANGL